jgi:2-oxoisovalerate dehydrogenase E2 component (dihydrolipoyl transacylase)
VEITSRFDGIIKRLHYEADDMAKVGSPLVDIDIQSEILPEDEALTKAPGEPIPEQTEAEKPATQPQKEMLGRNWTQEEHGQRRKESQSSSPGKHATLATPAVRHLTKELKINLTDVRGSGKEGRVLKEDVQKFASARDAPQTTMSTPSIPLGEDKTTTFSPIQRKMYETMTKSLSIPHFLYSDTIDFTSLSKARRAINSHSSASTSGNLKLSALPFIIKAVSLAFITHPSLNALLETSTDSSKPVFIHKASHNIGFAVDTPQGLMVPVIRSVQSHSITSLAAEISRLGTAARNNRLTSADLTGATFTVSNIGNIGGTTVAPVIVGPQVAIVGVGKARVVPAFGEDGSLVRKEECVFSWSADHRVVDGATVARCAEMVREYLEGVERMLVRLR